MKKPPSEPRLPRLEVPIKWASEDLRGIWTATCYMQGKRAWIGKERTWTPYDQRAIVGNDGHSPRPQRVAGKLAPRGCPGCDSKAKVLRWFLVLWSGTPKPLRFRVRLSPAWGWLPIPRPYFRKAPGCGCVIWLKHVTYHLGRAFEHHRVVREGWRRDRIEAATAKDGGTDAIA